MTLGGSVCIRNGNQLDYCWKEAIQSLLPVCDEVVVCDGCSTDGTQEEIREWSGRERKLKLCVYPWPNPVGDIDFWVNWLNFARTHLTTDFHFQLDADEILSEKSYNQIEGFKANTRPRISLWCHRFNFWKDSHSLIPHGVCCGHRVVRIAPTTVWMPSDGPHPKGAEAISMAIDSGIEIFHYGFLRKREAFFSKARALQEFFFNSYDPRLDAVERLEILSGEKSTGNWMADIKGIDWINQLVPFTGQHPEIAKPWLKERGYEA